MDSLYPKTYVQRKKITFLGRIGRELWSFIGNGGHLGRHLEFLKLLKGDNMSSSSF